MSNVPIRTSYPKRPGINLTSGPHGLSRTQSYPHPSSIPWSIKSPTTTSAGLTSPQSPVISNIGSFGPRGSILTIGSLGTSCTATQGTGMPLERKRSVLESSAPRGRFAPAFGSVRTLPSLGMGRSTSFSLKPLRKPNTVSINILSHTSSIQ